MRRGDVISPNTLSAILESVNKKCNWDKCGVNVDEKLSNQLWFADDIVLLTHTSQEAERMECQPNGKGNRAGLQFYSKKAKLMSRTDSQTPLQPTSEEAQLSSEMK
ncbi:hypothetical protein ANCDUO_01843 [Ancylostoma duodenale]|uniref:Reverse transcriptase domain-containing protein n=1 Tax=Ancylostoma duodenale TaxID=51022 RepID=A0A0C2H8B2_9BILA|nr:hypothetical protein ANCDUO_01843 [Ancylostoma duodenale]